jgi:hypothetical protein
MVRRSGGENICTDPRIEAKTPSQRWRFRRDLVILAAWRGGVSQRTLSDVFDLARSRIATIIERMNALAGYGRDFD